MQVDLNSAEVPRHLRAKTDSISVPPDQAVGFEDVSAWTNWELRSDASVPVSLYTVNKKGARQLLLRTTDNEKMRITVMLACTADKKLPLYVVLKRKTPPKGEPFSSSMMIRCNEKC